MRETDQRTQAATRARARVRRCVCLNLRRVGRRVTRHYDEALRPAGINSTQLPILSVLQYRGPLPVGQLAEELDLERTSLARILRTLVRNGWVEMAPGEDRRTRFVHLSEAGHRVVADAEPLWLAAQEEIEDTLGRVGSEQLLDALRTSLGILRDTAP